MKKPKTDLSQEKLKELFRYYPKTGKFHRILPSGKIKTKPSGWRMPHGHLQIGVNNRIYLAHRLAWLYVFGYLPEKPLDHKDGNPGNNRIRNLREASVSQNLWNSKRPSTNTSGVKGIHFDIGRGKWMAYCRGHGGKNFRKRFDTKKAAIEALKHARFHFHGEFARH